MNGTRLHYIEGEPDFVFRIFETPGSYGKHNDVWYCSTPNGLAGNLSKHTVIEHEDGTITVSPSILVTSGRDGRAPTWHGFLQRGVWSEC